MSENINTETPAPEQRIILDHVCPGNPLNEAIEIRVMDSPGAGGANHFYSLRVHYSEDAAFDYSIRFQKGGIQEAGVNGVSNEALLAVVIDRLRSFQAGPFPSRENALALTKLQEAMMWLHQRTLDRVHRGVEGRSVK